MNEIRCPNCGKVFQVDEAGYAAIVSQVHNEQFEKELADRSAALRREMEASGKNALTLTLKDGDPVDMTQPYYLAAIEHLNFGTQMSHKLNHAFPTMENLRPLYSQH